MKKSVISIFMVLIALAACQSEAPMENIQSSKISEKLGKEKINTLLTSSKATIEYSKKNNEKKELSSEEIKKIQLLLLSDKGYIFDRTKKCLFIPEITITFISAVELKIEISSLCKQVKFGEGKQVVILDIDPMFDEFIAYCYALLNKTTGAHDE